MATLFVINEKRNRGVEDVLTVPVSIQLSQFKLQLGMAIESNTLEEYFKSALFKKEFKLEGDTIKCTRTM
jgi:hypothetical protein